MNTLTQGTLYVVSTPIGNAEDITLRALRVLHQVDFIAAESIPRARSLLSRWEINTEIVSYHPRIGQNPEETILQLLRSGKSGALICDAGTPTLCDPGSSLIRKAIHASLPLQTLPGASAVLVALAHSGFSYRRFAFEGFPPRSCADRQKFFASLASEPRTLVLYESPRFLLSTLRKLSHTLDSTRSLLVACDLTKPTERIYRGNLSTLPTLLPLKIPRGEYVLVVEGNP